MRYYETLYIVNPDLEDDRLVKVQKEVDDWVSEKGAKIVNSYVWGRRKLAYPVSSYQYGTYMLLNFGVEHGNSPDQPFVLEFNQWMELHSAVLAHLTIHLDEEPRVRTGEERESEQGG